MGSIFASEKKLNVVFPFSRYAALRRRLLINPHISKDESNFRDHVMDNPLSQNPGTFITFYIALILF